MKCLECGNAWEVDVNDVGLEPFDTECPSCNREVGSEFGSPLYGKIERLNEFDVKEKFEPELQKLSDFIKKDYQKNEFAKGRNFNIVWEYGNKFIKVITSVGQRSVWGFIDRNNGDIYKAATWSRPAKHVRGNLFDKKTWSKFEWTGPQYLKENQLSSEEKIKRVKNLYPDLDEVLDVLGYWDYSNPDICNAYFERLEKENPQKFEEEVYKEASENGNFEEAIELNKRVEGI